MSSEQELQRARAQLESSERREALAERQCERYRRAFMRVLHEPFSDLDSTIAGLLEVLSTTLDVDRVGLWAFDDADVAIRCTHQYQRRPSHRWMEMTLKRSDYPCYFAALCRQLTFATTDAWTDPRTSELLEGYLKPFGIRAMMDVPVIAFGRCIGVLCHEHTGGLREWNLDDQNFAAGVATQTALAFERDRLKRTQEKLLRASLIDQDTQLPNYAFFESQTNNRLEAEAVPVAVVVARIDQHQLAANTFGREQSLALLRLAVERLATRLPSGATLARIARDEFAVLIANASQSTLADDIARWTTALNEPLVVREVKLFATLSVGFAVCNEPGKCTAEQLIANARMAMFQARQEGGARTLAFVPAMRERSESRLRIEQEMRHGIAANEFVLHFQPIMDLRSMRCVGAEALLRWQHPTRGLLHPDDFMPVAIESGAIFELGRHSLRAACQGLARMRKQTKNPNFTVSVNMSAPEILASGTADLACQELRCTGLPPSALTLEVTETSLLDDLESAATTLSIIRSSGIHVSLDDFGTAFSSLSWMHVLPIDSVKIDRGFVEGIPTNHRSVTLVRAIANLSHTFNREVIAEGIETEQQLRAVQEMGITFGQGFLFAKAQPCERYTQEWIASLGCFES